MRHVAVLEPSAGKWGSELWDTCLHQIPPRPGSGFEAVGHVMALEPSSAGKLGLELWNTWQHVVACLAPCHGLMPVCGVPGLQV
jgi:hypothetical protein